MKHLCSPHTARPGIFHIRLFIFHQTNLIILSFPQKGEGTISSNRGQSRKVSQNIVALFFRWSV